MDLKQPDSADAEDQALGRPAQRWSLTVLPAGVRVSAPADSALLQSAARGGWVLPSSCRNGSCRACLCRMTAGAVRYAIAWPSLLAEEKQAGWVLPCVAMPVADVVIEQPDAIAVATVLPRRPARGF